MSRSRLSLVLVFLALAGTGCPPPEPAKKPAPQKKTGVVKKEEKLPTLAELKDQIMGATTREVRAKLGAPTHITPVPQRPGEVHWNYDRRITSDASAGLVVFFRGEVALVR